MVFKLKSYLALSVMLMVSGAINASSEGQGQEQGQDVSGEENGAVRVEVWADRGRVESFRLARRIAGINTPSNLQVNVYVGAFREAVFRSDKTRHAAFSVCSYNILTAKVLGGVWGQSALDLFIDESESLPEIIGESEVEIFQ